MLCAIGETLLQVAGGPWVVTGLDGTTRQIGIGASDMFLPSSLQSELQTPLQIGTPLLIIDIELSCSYIV